MKLLYPTSLKFDASLLEGFGVSPKPYDVRKTIPEEDINADILVTWCNSSKNLEDAASRMKNLRWIQSLAAGPNDVLNAGFDTAKIQVTTGSGLHDRPVAEHAVSLLLSAARRLHEMRDYQLQSKWPGHLGGPQSDRPNDSFRTLQDARVLIWGFGNIGKTLGNLLVPFGANVRGVARTAGVRDGFEVITEEQLPRALSETDALVMILPGSDATFHALNKNRLAQLPKHAWIFNLGRGSAIDEDALVEALERGSIGGAGLDVFATEPLPASSKLWRAPNLFVSPHAAGGRPQGAEDLTAANLRRFLAGQKLQNKL